MMLKEIYQNFKAGQLVGKIKGVESAGGKFTKDELLNLQLETLRLAKSKCAEVRSIAKQLQERISQ